MKKTVLSVLLLTFLLLSCARTWTFQPIEAYKPASAVPAAASCQKCHDAEFKTWQETRHGDAKYMERIPVAELRDCGACHDVAVAHLEAPKDNIPPRISKMTKTEKNTLCGKCHYNQALFGNDAINPHDRHALYKEVGLEGYEKQIACLDCHSGHHGKNGMGEMLVRYKPNLCFECHTSVLSYSMGIFQPFNYLTYGKMCQACHTVHGGSPSAQNTRMAVGFCIICHVVGTSLVD